MTDYEEGIKKEIAEVKFLIHDLRVGRSINEIIHYHVALDADLEIHNVDQVQILHAEDLAELRRQGVSLRKDEKDYQNAVRSRSPDKTILLLGKRYIRKIREICELVLNPLWGRIDKVLSFLPDNCRSVESRKHYRNHGRWISGVHSRIEHFLDELRNIDLHEKFDVATELEQYTRNVLYGYVVEKGGARVELRLQNLDAAVIEGNRYRFRRMFFNLIMNAVDAMKGKKVGVIDVSSALDGDDVVLRVRDSGAGMSKDKMQRLMEERASLDGELHSLGFVFVRQTVGEFRGAVSIDSVEGDSTTISVRLPRLVGAEPPSLAPSEWDEYDLLQSVDRVPGRSPEPIAGRKLRSSEAGEVAGTVAGDDAADGSALDESPQTHCGAMVLRDYQICSAQFPGSIFAIAVTPEDKVDFFTHRPYERYFNINHEDLSPMFYEATVRGRLEEDDEKEPVLILKSPQNVREYFEFKNVPENQRSAALYEQMVREEYVRVARILLATGLPGDLGVLLSDLQRFFADCPELFEQEPFPLERLAKQDVCVKAG